MITRGRRIPSSFKQTARVAFWIAILSLVGCGTIRTGGHETTTLSGPGGLSGAAEATRNIGAAYRGGVFFTEGFEDDNLASRGWYDDPQAARSTMERHEGEGSFQCRFEKGATGCTGGRPGRHLFPPSEAIYLSYWVKYSQNYVGSGRAYQPHEFYFLTDHDNQYVGPAKTFLTIYIEQVGGTPRLALQDSKNVDPNCVLRNNDSTVGCRGDFSTYSFTENRSVAACNGLAGDLDGRDCYSTGPNSWYSSRFWRSRTRAFTETPGPHDKSAWHFIEVYLKLNTIQNGVGVPDGKIRYWFDGELLIHSDRILMRTARHADMRFNQLLVAPYMGDGSPTDQSCWIDEITVAAGVP